MALKKTISLRQAIFYGVGVIIGAGIYSLIGVAAGIAGPALWLAFVIAGLIAGLTASSYAQLTHRFPKEAAESVYVLNATKRPGLAFFIGFISFITALFSIGAVAWGFVAYFKLFFAINPLFVALALIILLSLINLIGIQESVAVNNVMALITILGLLIIIVFGFPSLGSVNLLTGNTGAFVWENGFALIPSILAAASLIFFAYLGFEEIANVTEEMRNARKNAPKAILASLIIATVLYVLVAMIAVSVIPPQTLFQATNPNVPLTDGPLALVGEKAIGEGFGFWISLFALCATASTILVLLNVSSRVLYGMSREGLLPKILSITSAKTNTPYVAIALVALLAMCVACLQDLRLLGEFTTVGTFLLFFSVNASFVIIHYKEQKNNSSFLQKIAFPSLLGALFCLGMFLTQYWQSVSFMGTNVPLILIATCLFCTAFPLYYLTHKKKRSRG